jgi:hypothetical protein
MPNSTRDYENKNQADPFDNDAAFRIEAAAPKGDI